MREGNTITIKTKLSPPLQCPLPPSSIHPDLLILPVPISIQRYESGEVKGSLVLKEYRSSGPDFMCLNTRGFFLIRKPVSGRAICSLIDIYPGMFVGLKPGHCKGGAGAGMSVSGWSWSWIR